MGFHATVAAVVRGLPQFSLPRLGRSAERLCTSLIMRLNNTVLIESNKSSRGGPVDKYIGFNV